MTIIWGWFMTAPGNAFGRMTGDLFEVSDSLTILAKRRDDGLSAAEVDLMIKLFSSAGALIDMIHATVATIHQEINGEYSCQVQADYDLQAGMIVELEGRQRRNYSGWKSLSRTWKRQPLLAGTSRRI